MLLAPEWADGFVGGLSGCSKTPKNDREGGRAPGSESGVGGREGFLKVC